MLLLGEVGDLPSQKRNPRQWHETEGSRASLQPGLVLPICKWIDGSNVASQTGDICRMHSWVGYHAQPVWRGGGWRFGIQT